MPCALGSMPVLSTNMSPGTSELVAVLLVGTLCSASAGPSGSHVDSDTTDALAKVSIAWHAAVVAAFAIEFGWLGASRRTASFARIFARCGVLWHVLALIEGLGAVGYFGDMHDKIGHLLSSRIVDGLARLVAWDTLVRAGAGSARVTVFCSAIAALFWAGRYTRHSRRKRRGMSIESLRGELVVITGAAGDIGREMSLAFARQGAKVSLWDIREKALTEAALWLISHGIRGEHVATSVVDVSDAASVAAAADALRESEGGQVPRVVVSNAAVMRGKSLLDHSDAEIRGDFSVNVLASFWVHRRFLRQMLEDGTRKERSPEGVLVTMGSIMAELPAARQAEYCASKAALSQFHECLRWELKKANDVRPESTRRNVRSLLIQPYAVKTSMISGASFLGGGTTSVRRRFALIGKVLPPLEPAAVARRTLDAVVRGEERVYIPGVVGLLPVILRLLPPSLREHILGLCGAYDGMDGFCGNAPVR